MYSYLPGEYPEFSIASCNSKTSKTHSDDSETVHSSFKPNPDTPEFIPQNLNFWKSNSTQKKIPLSKLEEGFHLFGNGRESVFVNIKKIPIMPVPRDYSPHKPSEVPFKYWNQRYNIFSRFDEGIQMDLESWFSVTHEPIAKVIAEQCKHFDVIMDGFAGAGGNVIQFAGNSRTIGIDLDPEKLSMLWHNAGIYGVRDKIKLISGDFCKKAIEESPDLIFMSPPWGGPNYRKAKKFDIYKHVCPDITQIMQVCNKVTKNIILYMPRNVNPYQIAQLFKFMPGLPRKLEFQMYTYGNKVKTVGCFFGDFVQIDSNSAISALLSKKKSTGKFRMNHDVVAHRLEQAIKSSGVNAAINLLYNKK